MYFSPGRINLIGEHIDYNDGFVLPAAINLGICSAIAPNNTNRINLFAQNLGEAFTITIDKLTPVSDWPAYPLSVVNEFLQSGLPIQGFDYVFGGTIPRGSGLSSSAAVEGALAFALNDIFAFGLDRTALAKLCQRAEHGYPGVQCGIMDQFANMLGQQDKVILLDCRSLQYQYFPLTLEGYSIVLFNSMVHHALASGEYNLRRQQCRQGLALTGHHSFRDITDTNQLEPFRLAMGQTLYNRCAYVVEEIQRTRQAALCLQNGDITALGQLMYDTHKGLSEQYEVSCPELDFLVNLARQNNAVAGARVMGGGFGGCTINIVRSPATATLISHVEDAYKTTFNRQLETYTVTTAPGTCPLIN